MLQIGTDKAYPADQINADPGTTAFQQFLAGTGGNVALRTDDEHFAVTPSATDYYAMNAADVCIVRLSDKQQVDGELRRSQIKLADITLCGLLGEEALDCPHDWDVMLRGSGI